MPDFDFTAEEKKDLHRARYFESLKNSPAWLMLEAEMHRLVDEAQIRLQAAGPETPAEEIKALHMRWQQRGLMRDSLLNYVNSLAELKKDILERGLENDGIPADTGIADES